MALTSQGAPKTKQPHFATLLVMALAPQEVGRRIRQARIAKGWTHDRLALEAGVNTRTVQRWQKGWDEKKGKSLLPRLHALMELADLLGVPRSVFVEEDLPVSDSAALDSLAARLERLEKHEVENAEMLAELLRIVRGEQQDSPAGESGV